MFLSPIYYFVGSFEIVMNDQLVFSKLELGGFPEKDDVSNFAQSIYCSYNAKSQ